MTEHDHAPVEAICLEMQRSQRRYALTCGGLLTILIVASVADPDLPARLVQGPLSMVGWLLLAFGFLLSLSMYARAGRQMREFVLEGDGVRTGTAMIRWDDIDEIYVGGSRTRLYDLVTVREERSLALVCSDGRRAELELLYFGAMSEPSRRAYDSIVETVLLATVQRQWRALERRLEAGEVVPFGDRLRVSRGGLVDVLDQDREPIALSDIDGLIVDNGALKLRHRDRRGRVRTRKLGPRADIANVHLLERLLHHHGRANTLWRDATARGLFGGAPLDEPREDGASTGGADV